MAAEYIGRKFDILAFRGAQPQGKTQLSQSLFGADVGGEVCTGAQKLAQRWILEFMTQRGTMGFHLQSRGSDFLRWARQGYLRTEFDVRAYFNFSAQQVHTNLTNEETADTPDDERLRRAELLQTQISDGFLSLYTEISSVAGDARRVILPIPIVPANITL